MNMFRALTRRAGDAEEAGLRSLMPRRYPTEKRHVHALGARLIWRRSLRCGFGSAE